MSEILLKENLSKCFVKKRVFENLNPTLEERKYILGSDPIKDLFAYFDQVFCICLRFSSNLLDAEDLSQESYLRAIAKIGTLNNDQFFKEWLLKIARNTCLNFLKKRRLNGWFFLKSENEFMERNTPEFSFIKKELHAILKRAVQDLPKIYREVIILMRICSFLDAFKRRLSGKVG